MGEHLAAASCLALVLNFFLLWAASCDAAHTEEDGMSLLQWEKAPPPPPSIREEELSAVRFKRDAKRYGHNSFYSTILVSNDALSTECSRE